MEETLVNLLPSNLHRIFNERDVLKRKAAIRDLWNEDGVFIDPEGIHRGHDALSNAVDTVQQQFPGFVFSIISVVQENYGVGRVSWSFGPAGEPGVLHGLDVGIARDGKISSLYTFID